LPRHARQRTQPQTREGTEAQARQGRAGHPQARGEARMRAGLVLWLGLLAARPGAAQDRWQLTLNSGTTLWDLSLVKLAGDTLVVRHADSTYALPLAQVDEIRLVQKSTRHITPEAGRYGGVLGGVDDEVHRLTLYSVPERRAIVQQVLLAPPPPCALARRPPAFCWSTQKRITSTSPR